MRRSHSTTNADGDVDGLGYQATGGAFIYRRSIAKDVFGTDDPAQIAEILGAGTNSWDKFWEAAAKLAENNVAIVSGDGDVWHAVENSSETGWINADGQLHIDPKREAFLDISKNLIDNKWSNATQDWQDAWFADMKGQGEKPVFGFFGPAWLINYTLAPNCGGSAPGEGTYGDWAVCAPPIGFFWGGTWVMANKNMDPEKHREWTGHTNEKILENFRAVCEEVPDKTVRARTPIIPGFNDNARAVEAIAEFLEPFGSHVQYEMLPYHKFGREKYFYLGRDYAMGDAELNKKKFAALQGVARKILGDRFIS